MQTTQQTQPVTRAVPVETKRNAIWRLFEEGQIDEDVATTSLLAIDLEIRRSRRNEQAALPAHPAKRTRRARVTLAAAP